MQYPTTTIAVSGRMMHDEIELITEYNTVKIQRENYGNYMSVFDEFKEALKTIPTDSFVCFELGDNDLSERSPADVVQSILMFAAEVPKTMTFFYLAGCGLGDKFKRFHETEREFYELLMKIPYPVLDMRPYKG